MGNKTKQSNYKDQEQSINELFQRSLKFTTSDECIKFFRFIAKFTHYSHYNAMLVYIQNPEVDYFGSVPFWKKNFNRQVKRNAKPYIILANHGPVMLVYDIHDTVGEKKPEQVIEEGINNGVFGVSGHIDEKILEKAIKTAYSYGIYIKQSFLRFNEGGYTESSSGIERTPDIVLNSKATAEETFRILMHELAHIFLGHFGEKILTKEYVNQKGQKVKKTVSINDRQYIDRYMREIEAETVSYLVCAKQSLNSESEKYLSEYLDCNTFRNLDIRNVIKTAEKIEKIFC